MISPRTLRTAIGRTSASYPVPFLGAALLGSGVLILVLSIKLPTGSTAFWAFFFLALLLFTSAVALIAFAAVNRPDLLRNDRTVVMQQVMDIFSDDETGDRLERVVSRYFEQPRSTLRGSTQRKQRQLDRPNDGDDGDA